LKQNIFETLEFDKILIYLSSTTVSPLGEELVQAITPSTDFTRIQEKLSEVTEMRALTDFDDPFPIYGLDDIRIPLKKAALAGNYLSLDELVHVLGTLVVFRNLTGYFKIRKDKYPLLNRIASGLSSFMNIEKELNRCININTNELYDRASPDLARIRKAIGTSQHKIRKKMDEMVLSFSHKKYLQENVVTIRDGRLVLMVKDEHRQQVKGIIHDQSATGATLFIEPMETLELNNQIRALLLEEKREIDKILLELTGLIRNEQEAIQRSLTAAAQLDFIHAKAQLSAKLDGYQPRLNSGNRMTIIDGRHPLLILKYGAKNKVVPLSLMIGEDFNTLIITGPNAGGKTVALKTIGLLSLMVSCGLHVPVTIDSEMCIFQHIFSVIGDQQSIENDLSTFSSHIEKLKYIVDHVSRQDLVIIDEIGSGTDPEEGAALAIAILEKLTKVGCISLISTHQGALKAFAHETERVENGSMEFNAETLQPTYRFRLGLPGSSYAFEIAQRWGLPENIITRSRQLVGVEKHRLENLLVDLEKNLTQYQERLQELHQQRGELDHLTKTYQEKRRELLEHEKSLKKKAVEETNKILSSANAAVELAIKEIREQQASREAIKEAKNLLESEQAKIKEIQQQLDHDYSPPQAEPLEEIAIGKQVLWKDYNTKGIILSEVDAANRVLIDTGGVKIRVAVSELQQIAPTATTPRKISVKFEHESNAHPEIDLRGLRAEEAIQQTEKFIEEALLAGLETVTIIHGKGTGALRKSIHSFLEQHPHVKTKELAEWNQGGTGVTVVKLR